MTRAAVEISSVAGFRAARPRCGRRGRLPKRRFCRPARVARTAGRSVQRALSATATVAIRCLISAVANARSVRRVLTPAPAVPCGAPRSSRRGRCARRLASTAWRPSRSNAESAATIAWPAPFASCRGSAAFRCRWWTLRAVPAVLPASRRARPRPFVSGKQMTTGEHRQEGRFCIVAWQWQCAEAGAGRERGP